MRRAEKARAAGFFHVALLRRAVAVLHTDEGLRAAGKDQKPVVPASVQKYLLSKFGDALPAVLHAMETLAKSQEPEALAEEGFRLYESFRPGVPAGEIGGDLGGERAIAYGGAQNAGAEAALHGADGNLIEICDLT